MRGTSEKCFDFLLSIGCLWFVTKHSGALFAGEKVRRSQSAHPPSTALSCLLISGHRIEVMQGTWGSKAPSPKFNLLPLHHCTGSLRLGFEVELGSPHPLRKVGPPMTEPGEHRS